MVGNPPFLSQLSSLTALDRGCAAIIKQRLGRAASAYTDSSALFLADALRKLAPAGRVSFLLPQSFLASRDAAVIRKMIRESHTLEHLWVSGEHVFEQAFIATCAPVVLSAHSPDANCTSTYSLDFRESESKSCLDGESGSGTWSYLAANARGLPEVTLNSCTTISDIAIATADFRDEYYGLSGFIVDLQQADGRLFPKLITTSMIDPACIGWGQQPHRILKERWQSPRVDRERMHKEGSLSAWIEARLVPKVLIATQSNVIESVVDGDGIYLPCMPVITACPKPGVGLWHLASALSSPIACLYAVRHYAGTAMTPDAIKLSAKQVLTLPIPAPGGVWDSAARRFRVASECVDLDEKFKHLILAGSDMCDAFGIKRAQRDELAVWWENRLAKTMFKAQKK
ncbi:MAG: hypothetical protein ED559_08765 [Phycisphaera sp.]|nr:MAG: hypothetical protein ED559_08765 [Phycisphaera sp.]